MKMTRNFGIGLLGAAGICLGARAEAAPGPAEQSYTVWSYDNSGCPAVLGGPDGDDRLYTGDGDWRYGFNKTECGAGYKIMVGLATNTSSSGVGANSGRHSCPNPDSWFNWEYHWTTQAALCVTSNTIYVDYSHGVSVWFGDADARRDRSTGDWARYLAKTECGPNEVMTGFAQQKEGINEFRCSPASTVFEGNTLVATSCDVVDFDGHDASESGPSAPERGDWAYGDSKGTCGPNRYLKGFAVDSQNGTTRPVKILCCGAQVYPDGYGCSADAQCAGGYCPFYSGFDFGVCQTPVVK